MSQKWFELCIMLELPVAQSASKGFCCLGKHGKHLLFPSSDGIYFDGLNLYCTVCLVCRVGGVLIPTRSFGDFLLKSEQDKPAWKQVISVVPQIQTFKLDSCWEFIVVGSDGVWDAMSNAEMTNFVKGRLTSATSHLSTSRKPGQVYGWTPTQLPPSWH